MKKIYITLIISILIPLASNAQQNVDLLYNWSDEEITGSSLYNNSYNEVWGVVVNNKEFAIMGSTEGTHIFDVTDPENTEEIFFIAGKDAGDHIIHRDYHDYNGYLYAVCDEGESSLQIIDISDLPNTIDVVYDSDELIIQSHNIFIDEQNKRMYSCGSKLLVEGNFTFNHLDVFSLESPEAPEIISTFNDIPGTHDVYVLDNTVYMNAGSNGLHILDYNDPNNPTVIGSLEDYPDKGYNHSGWLTEDGQTYIFADEDWGYDLKVCDVSDLSDIEVVTTFSSEVNENSIPHNQIIKGNLLFVSYYHDGLQVYNIADPENPEKVAYYNTYLEDDHESYRGAWGVYPFLPSGNILVSDMQYGLYVLRLVDDLDQDELTDENLSIHPNPFQDQITLNLPEGTKSYEFTLTDIKGNEVFNDQLSGSTNTVQLPASLSMGIYVVRISNDQYHFTQKLIKTNR